MLCNFPLLLPPPTTLGICLSVLSASHTLTTFLPDFPLTLSPPPRLAGAEEVSHLVFNRLNVHLLFLNVSS